MLDAIVQWLGLLILRLRYRLEVRGLDAIRARGARGILFLPNHPAFIDPIIINALLLRPFRPRPIGDRDQIQRWPASWLARFFRARPIADVAKDGPAAREQIAAVLRDVAQGLRQGENALIYPSGHLYRTRYEDLRGNSSAEQILCANPEARVVLVRTHGLWGSRFSMARGDFPNVVQEVLAGIGIVLGNLLLLTPRRRVTIEFAEPANLPRERQAFNTRLESFYNENAPPNLHVPYWFWQGSTPAALPDPEIARPSGDSTQVPAATRELVLAHMRELTGIETLQDDMRLASDLNMDSLARLELLVWLGREFGFQGGDVAALQTVGDVLLAARGEASLSRQIELAPPPRSWSRPRERSPIVIPPGERITDIFLAQARRGPGRVVAGEPNGGVRTYRQMILGLLLLTPRVAALPGERVGILLPASVGAVAAYLAALFAGKTPVMLNWTTGVRNMQHAMKLCGVQRILTARPLIARLESQGLDLSALEPAMVHLDELRTTFTRWQKISALIRSYLDWSYLDRAQVSDTAAILLTSGSEALPKAVPLSHRNILTNVRDVPQLAELNNDDRIIAFLPPFHSFGITVTTLLPLLAGIRAVYHANPTEAWALARIIEAYGVTLIVGTPTFLGGILRASRPGQLATLRIAVTGAEKCPDRTYDLLAERCPKIVVLEGYGVTECSPVIAANREQRRRRGTIGLPMPSVEVAIVDLDRMERVAAGETGMLLARGPSVFAGYLGDAASPFVEFEGKSWYRTGDLVAADPDGMLVFRGRLKRFVKLGGEMISLPAIEAALAPHFEEEQDDGPVIAVESTPSEDHPEIVLFATRDVDRAAANRLLRDAQLSPLHNITRVVRVDEIPVLGTGKTDYRSLRERLKAEASPAPQPA